MKFPIYHVNFTLYAGENELAGCEQDMMLITEFENHKAAEESLWRIVQSLGENLNVLDMVTSWCGSITLARHDEWCKHWESFYTYRTFPDKFEALAQFLIWGKFNKQYFEPNPMFENWHVCECELCKTLGRTMILLLGEKECPDCSYVS